METVMRRSAIRKLLFTFSAVGVSALLFGPVAEAQNRRVPQERLLRHLLQLEQKMSPEQRDRLSAGFGNYLAFAHAVLDPRSAGPDDEGGKPPAVCYSDRRNDPHNMAIDHFCSLSQDQGVSFTDVRETPFSWSPDHLEDVFVNPVSMGDYDAVSTDATGANAGSFSTFEIQTNTNPDVFGMRLKF